VNGGGCQAFDTLRVALASPDHMGPADPKN
jgi:hypothetical protein